MSYLGKWNRLFFGRGLSIFDVFVLTFVIQMAAVRLWYMLLLIPQIFISVLLERTFAKDEK